MTENEVLKDLQNYQGILKAKTRINAGVNPKIALDAITQAIEVIQQYRAIGTIEEFKALKEKNEPKRLLTREEKYPQNYGMYSTSDRWCPCCRGLVFTGDWSVHKQNIMYKRIRCGCGQKLDWSE